MRKFIIPILVTFLLISVGLNLYWYYYPNVRSLPGKIIYLPDEKPEAKVYELPKGNQAIAVKDIKDIHRKKVLASKSSNELLDDIKSIPDLENLKKIDQLISTNSKLELQLNESKMVLNDKVNQIKKWEDLYNKVTINNLTNQVDVVSEVSPVVILSNKREGFLKAKEFITTITSKNPSVKFYGVESYTFKNPKQKDFLELNLKGQAIYINDNILPTIGAEIQGNPDGKIKYIIGAGYFYNMTTGKFELYYNAALQYNLFRL